MSLCAKLTGYCYTPRTSFSSVCSTLSINFHCLRSTSISDVHTESPSPHPVGVLRPFGLETQFCCRLQQLDPGSRTFSDFLLPGFYCMHFIFFRTRHWSKAAWSPTLARRAPLLDLFPLLLGQSGWSGWTAERCRGLWSSPQKNLLLLIQTLPPLLHCRWVYLSRR